MSVDLPAPLSPSRPTISRRFTWKLTSASDRTSPKVFETFRSSITGGSLALEATVSAIPIPFLWSGARAGVCPTAALPPSGRELASAVAMCAPAARRTPSTRAGSVSRSSSSAKSERNRDGPASVPPRGKTSQLVNSVEKRSGGTLLTHDFVAAQDLNDQLH